MPQQQQVSSGSSKNSGTILADVALQGAVVYPIPYNICRELLEVAESGGSPQRAQLPETQRADSSGDSAEMDIDGEEQHADEGGTPLVTAQGVGLALRASNARSRVAPLALSDSQHVPGLYSMGFGGVEPKYQSSIRFNV